MLFRKHGLWNRRILHDAIVVTKYIGWSVNRCAKHSQFITQHNQHILRSSEGNKLAAKARSLDRVLAPLEPNNWCVLHMDNDSSVRQSHDNIACVISINETGYQDALPFWFRHICHRRLN